jgi:hypothetical protein
MLECFPIREEKEAKIKERRKGERGGVVAIGSFREYSAAQI